MVSIRKLGCPDGAAGESSQPALPDKRAHCLGGAPSLQRSMERSAAPDEREALAVLDEVGVDGSREARIVELDRDVVALLTALGSALPAGTERDRAGEDPVVGGGLARLHLIGNDLAPGGEARAEPAHILLWLISRPIGARLSCQVRTARWYGANPLQKTANAAWCGADGG